MMLKSIKFSESIEDLKESDFIVEAASEDFNLKKKIFSLLASIAPPHSILATNTSSISITKIAGCIPERAH